METIDREAVSVAADWLRQRDADWERRRLALVLGSGWGKAADTVLEVEERIEYAAIPGFPRSTVAGHAGRLVLGRVADCPVWCLQGRFHYYEGHSMASVVLPVRVLAALGVGGLLLTNAAGGIREDLRSGELMVIRDHINLMGVNPLRGVNDEQVGPRFPDMTAAWDGHWRKLLQESGEEAGIDLAEGVYLAVSGPNFETPAEVRAFGKLGADAVGMSTVPECLVARHAGLRVAGLSCITNAAAGLGEGELSHEEVGETAERAQGRIERLLAVALPKLQATLGSVDETRGKGETGDER